MTQFPSPGVLLDAPIVGYHTVDPLQRRPDFPRNIQVDNIIFGGRTSHKTLRPRPAVIKFASTPCLKKNGHAYL